MKTKLILGIIIVGIILISGCVQEASTKGTTQPQAKELKQGTEKKGIEEPIAERTERETSTQSEYAGATSNGKITIEQDENAQAEQKPTIDTIADKQTQTEPQKSIEKAIITDFSVYEDTINKFKVRYPSNWLKKELPKNIGVSFSSPGEINAGENRVYFNINVIDSREKTLEQFVDTTENGLKQMLKEGVSNLESTGYTLSSNPAHKFVYEYNQTTRVMKTTEILTIKNKKIYSISYIGENWLHEKYSNAAQTMIDSMEIG